MNLLCCPIEILESREVHRVVVVVVVVSFKKKRKEKQFSHLLTAAGGWWMLCAGPQEGEGAGLEELAKEQQRRRGEGLICHGDN